ncbi:MAG TPA: PQQ-binding-like beta-propeller repeat protein, partial [Pirellulales bacterium]
MSLRSFLLRSWAPIAVFGVSLLAASPSRTAEWPQFRGPGGEGISDESKLPDQWTAEKNVRWKAPLPGTGWSSPVVWGDKVFITTAITDNQPKPSSGGGGRGGFGGGGFGGASGFGGAGGQGGAG